MRTRGLDLVSMFALVAGLMMDANAQSTDSKTRVESKDQIIEEIVVTATKRPRSSQDIAGSITTVTGQQLGRLGADDIRSLGYKVAGLTFFPQGNSDSTTKVVLRGISNGSGFEATLPAVGVYMDEVPMGSSFGPGGHDIKFIDLERIEVLRGPQGTLYGAGSLGGTIRYITKKPNVHSATARLETEIGLTDAYKGDAVGAKTAGVLNVPLIADLAGLRAVFYHEDNEGYIANVNIGDDAVNGSRLTGGRLAFRVEQPGGWTVDLMGLYQENLIESRSYVDQDLSGKTLTGDLTQSLVDTREPSEIYNGIVSLAAQRDIGIGDLTFVASYANFERRQYSNIRARPTGALILRLIPGAEFAQETFDSEDTSYAAELRLASSTDRLEWLIGTFLQDYELTGRRFLWGTDEPCPPCGDLFQTLFDIKLRQQYETVALFGEISYSPSPSWQLTVGGRYNRVDLDVFQDLSGLIVSPAMDLKPSSESSFTPKLEATYRPNEKVMVYALVSKGFRSGGANLKIVSSVPDTFDEDFVWNYEVGIKSTLFEGRVFANLTGFHAEFEDLQTTATVGGLFPFFTNAGSASSTGVEFEVQSELSSALLVDFTATYDNAEYTSDAPAADAFDGDPIPLVPELVFSAAVEYRFPPWHGLDAFVNLNGRYVDNSVSDLAPLFRSNDIKLDAYYTFNATVGLLRRGQFEVAAFIQNISNERNEVFQFPARGVDPVRIQSTLITPRTVGLRLTLDTEISR